MSNRYIYADKVIAWCMETYRAQSTVTGKAYVRALLDAVDSCSTADVVEVVRCGECRYRDECNQYVLISGDEGELAFCSYGERRAEDEG